ncbi:MAG TPA: hypothetical protein VLK25_04585 [Allosphingosinicella sp.]|nr:hypothetical protein [Allosphingosinicella sp.]
MLLAAALLATQQPSPPPATPPPACESAEHRQFDFWIGRWDVYPTGTDRLVAHSLIERRYSGCAIRENWMPLRGEGGGSFSAWRPEARRWRQAWVDSSGAWVEFTGAFEDGAMVLTGPWAGASNGQTGIVRMRYTREAEGAVRQHGEVSTDNGATWSPSFDFTYRPAATAPAAQ